MFTLTESFRKILLFLILFVLLVSSTNLFAYGDGFFYIGGSVDAFNPRQESIYIDEGFPFGFGLHFGLNITSHLSFPDISGKYFRLTDKYESSYYSGRIYIDQIQYIFANLGLKYRFGDYRLQPFVRLGLTYENVRNKDIIIYEYGDEYSETDFAWGFAPYMGAGLSYYPTDSLSLDLGLTYTHGRGSIKTEEYGTFPLGGTTITSSLTMYPF